MDCLIVEGGGFRTGFTAGVLDAMLVNKYNPFNSYYGISGGSISLSYFISEPIQELLFCTPIFSRPSHFH